MVKAIILGMAVSAIGIFSYVHAILEAMPQLKPGEILEVIRDCAQSINNIPLDARNYGYTVLDIQQDSPMIYYLIQC